MDKIKVGRKTYSPQEVVHHARRAPGWFGAIAVFTLINSLLSFLNADLTFVVGLGVAGFGDGLISGAREYAGDNTAMLIGLIGLLINLFLVGIFAGIWWFARRGSSLIYLVGMVLYFLDGLLFLLFGDWIGLGLHAFFLFMLLGGYQFVRQRKQAEQLLSAGDELDLSPQQGGIPRPVH